MKIVITLLLLAIIVSLFSGLFFLLKDDGGKSKRTVNALTWRIGLQIALILVLVLAVLFGKIRPHGVFPTQNSQPTNMQSGDKPNP